jgi:hypothetical protein
MLDAISNVISGNQYILQHEDISPHRCRRLWLSISTVLVGINFWSPFKAVESVLRKLRPADMDASDRIECLQGTRVAMIQFIIGWALDPAGQKNVLWLHGLAGAGKSTLSTTIANRLCEMGRLGAFVFFDRDVIERSNPATVIRTLAYQVGSFHIHAGRAISTAIEKFPTRSFGNSSSNLCRR